jgi:lipoprotein-releasing system permease protein
MLGVLLGVMILIIALSVMNGSISFLRNEALKSVPHLTATSPTMSAEWPRYAEAFLGNASVLAIAPYVQFEALLSIEGSTEFIQVRGIEPALEQGVAGHTGDRAREALNALDETPNGVLLDSRLASRMGIRPGDELTIAALDRLLRRSKSAPQAFKVLGYADFGAYGGGNIVLLNRGEALMLDGNAQTLLRASLDDVFSAERVKRELDASNQVLGIAGIEFETWREAQASLFGALAMEKFLTGLMLLTIVAVGAVNIVSTLVMAVAEKGPDIAILRTMGASRGTVMRLFIVQGGVSGLIGTTLGALLGVLLAFNLAKLSLLLEQAFGWLTGNSNVVFVSHLQTQVVWSEVALVCFAGLLISLLATLYPAYRASKIEPAEVLRYE